MKDALSLWASDQTKQFVDVLVSLDNEYSMQAFLGDVMTTKEIKEMSARLQAAKMLTDGCKYTEITNATKLSSRTIARISAWLKNGYQGYAKALLIVSSHNNHILLDRAE